MRKLSRIFFVTVGIIVLAACNKENAPSFTPKTINAYVDDELSKTALDGVGVLWENNDRITVFDDDGVNRSSSALQLSSPTKNATFVIPTLDQASGVFAAVYPLDEDAVYDEYDCVYTTLPSEQVARKGSFGPNSNLAVAGVESSIGDLAFKNVGGILALSISSDVVSEIESVTLSADQAMSGPVIVDAADFSAIVDEDKSEGVKSVTLKGTFENGKYYFSVLPETYTGLTITFTRSDGATASFSNPNSLEVARNSNIFIGSLTINADNSKWQGGSTSNLYKAEITSFSEIKGDINEDISYEGFKGDAANAPAINNNCLRLYQNGAYVTISGSKGVKIVNITVTMSSTYDSTTVGYALDDDDAPTSGELVAKNESFTLTGLNNQSVSIYCLGTDKNSRADIASIQVEYTKEDVELSSIALSGEYKTSFVQNETFTHDGVVVTATYSDGDTQNVTADAEFSEPDMTTTGTKTVTVSYTLGGITKTATYEITVEAEVVSSLDLSGNYQTVFTAGDTFNYDNLVVTATYNGGRKADVTADASFSTPDMSHVGEQTITVSYGGQSTSYTITVNSSSTIFYESFDSNNGTGGNDDQWSGSIASNNLSSDNMNWTFVKGNGANKCAKFGAGSSLGSAQTPEISFSGSALITFKAAAWDGSKEETTLKISATSGILDAETVTLVKGEWTPYEIAISGVTSSTKIKFEGYKASDSRFFLDEVKVEKTEELELNSIAIAGTPTKLSYNAGEALDPAGLVVTGTYSDGNTAEITKGITWTMDPENLSVGITSCTVTAHVDGKDSDPYTVNGLSVTAPVTLTSIAVSGTPTKLSYNAGDAFEPAGLVVTGIYSDTHKETITEGITWNVPSSLSAGQTSCDVTATVSGITSTAYTVNGLTVRSGGTLKLENLGSSLGSTSNTKVSTVSITASQTSDTYILNYLQGKKQGESILLAKSTGAFISNKTPIPGNIKSVTVYINSGASGKTTYHCAFSETECTEATTTGSTAVNIAGGSSNKYTCSVSNARYFCISLGNANNGQVLSLEVEYY